MSADALDRFAAWWDTAFDQAADDPTNEFRVAHGGNERVITRAEIEEVLSLARFGREIEARTPDILATTDIALAALELAEKISEIKIGDPDA